jgi:putative phosphoribosyl transferase
VADGPTLPIVTPRHDAVLNRDGRGSPNGMSGGTASLFRDRVDGGRQLAECLEPYRQRRDSIVLGLARGGMPVAAEVARVLALPLDVFLVRKLGVPGHDELAMGAIASGGARVMNQEVVGALAIANDAIEAVAAREQHELERRERVYRDGRPAAELAGRVGILVDDGLATGASMRAAVQALKQRKAAGIVVAVPVAPPETCSELEREADAVVCAHTPKPFHAVGLWYDDFPQVTDDQVRQLLAQTQLDERTRT